MLEKFLEFLKNHTKVAITVVLTGIGALTVGYHNGCSVDFTPDGAPPAVTAPATP